MNQRRSDVPTYRHHRPSRQAVVTLAGQDIYLGRYGTAASRQEYDRVLSEWIASGRPDNTIGRFQITVVELCAAYLKFAKQHYQVAGVPSGELFPLKAALRILRQAYGPVRAVEFGPLALKALRERMIAKEWARTTINQQVIRLRRMFRWAVSEELLPPTVIQALSSVAGLRAGKTAAREPEPIQPVEEAVLEATLPHMPQIVGDMVRIQRLCGCRPSDICRLRPQDVDRATGVWLYRPPTHKTRHLGKQRTIFFGPRAQEILRPYLERTPDSYCFSPAESEEQRRAAKLANRKTPLKYGNRAGTNRQEKPRRKAGSVYTSLSFGRAVRRACVVAKVEVWSPNQLRHSAGTEIRRLFGLEAAQVALGHSRADVTQIYAERDLQKAVEVMRQIG